jgi:hypothetical protein
MLAGTQRQTQSGKCLRLRVCLLNQSSLPPAHELNMDRTLPAYKSIIVPVPEIRLVTEDRFKDLSLTDVTHVVAR